MKSQSRQWHLQRAPIGCTSNASTASILAFIVCYRHLVVAFGGFTYYKPIPYGVLPPRHHYIGPKVGAHLKTAQEPCESGH